MEKSSELSGDSQEFMEILSQFQKILLKSSKDFKFSCETQGDSIKIEVLIQKDAVKTEDDGWISNTGNDSWGWPDGYGITNNTIIEVKFRCGDVVTNPAVWFYHGCWRETDGARNDIIEFRIIK